MKMLKNSLPSLIVLAVVVALWWITVVLTESVIFPTPWQVVEGTLELARDGTLWEHIGASLFRVGAGFGIAVAFAIPLGLWMGWVRGAFVTLNPVFQILRPISPIAWIPIAILWFGVGNASPIYLIFIASVFPMIVQTRSACTPSRSATCVRPRTSASRAPCCFAALSFPPCSRRSSSACASASASPGWSSSPRR